MIVHRMKPGTRLRVVAADERIERAKETNEEEGELTFLALRIEPAPASNPGDGRFTGTDNFREIFSVETKAQGSGKCGFGENRRGRR